MLNGLHRGRLYVIAARPAMGKTTLVQNMAANAALRLGRKVLFASLETGESELAQRHLAAESGVAHQRLELAQLRGSPSASTPTQARSSRCCARCCSASPTWRRPYSVTPADR